MASKADKALFPGFFSMVSTEYVVRPRRGMYFGPKKRKPVHKKCLKCGKMTRFEDIGTRICASCREYVYNAPILAQRSR